MYGTNRTGKLKIITSNDETASPESWGAVRSDKPTLAIEIKGATLQYPIGAFVRGSLKSSLFSLLGHREKAPEVQFVDAITDLDLSIQAGERVGVIGSNGSGKSTLLRAMAGVYPLRSGSISVTGQIGTLLDISLGFEPESTGRENIYYRGMVMGYSRKQISEFEPEIVNFASLGEFIDLPMRTYSAGMYVRLGFAVSTQFQPDVLLIDEVFGAGDASFADRARERMNRIVETAGIVVLVSHDLGLISSFCNRVIWMNGGRLVQDGSPETVVRSFLEYMTGGASA
jgi:lipopolysaccharide transport system ATP-binding protein